MDALNSFLEVKRTHRIGELIFCATERRIVSIEEVSVGSAAIEFAESSLACLIVAVLVEHFEDAIEIGHLCIVLYTLTKSSPVGTMATHRKDASGQTVGETEIVNKGLCTILRKFKVASIRSFGRSITINGDVLHSYVAIAKNGLYHAVYASELYAVVTEIGE